MDALKLPASSAGLQSRTPPLIKAHILGGGPVRPVDGVSLNWSNHSGSMTVLWMV